MKKIKGLKGFTLVELVVTITIIIVLATISIPLYNVNSDKAKLAEGYLLLSTIQKAQQKYYSEYGTFIGYTLEPTSSEWKVRRDTVLGINATANKYFTCFKAGCGVSAAKYKYYFAGIVYKPRSLTATNDYALALQYNLTKGTKIVDFPKDYDESWTE